MKQEHYLKTELYQLLKSDSSVFEFIQKGSLDGIWYWDLQSPANEWMSPKFWELFGYDPSDKKHLSSQWQDIIFPQDLEKSIQNLNKHLKDPNHPYDQVVRYKHKNGSTVWVRCRGMAIRDTDGKALRMLGAHNDISHEKELEQKYLKKSKTLKAILDSSLDGVMAFESVRDAQGEIIDFIWSMSNKKSCEIVTIKEEELLQQRLSKMMPGNFAPLDSLGGKTLFEHYVEVVQSGKSKILEFYFEQDNIKEWFENKIVKYDDGFVVTFSIITEKKELQLHLKQRVQEEVEKNQKNQRLLFQQSKLAEMGSMLNMIAHQWRQPLNNVSLIFNNFFKKFQNKKLTTMEANRLASDFQQQIFYMSKTVDDFQNFFKPTKEKSTFTFANIVDETVSLIMPALEKERITVSVTCEDTLVGSGYKNELMQVLLNIINNAKDSLHESTSENKYIKIVVTKKDQNISILCEDNGGGVDEKFIDHIFNPYFSTKTEKNGTGLGLYMAKTIIEEHFRGKLEVQSTQGITRFIILLQA